LEVEHFGMQPRLPDGLFLSAPAISIAAVSP
jgi:hypothetical protein